MKLTLLLLLVTLEVHAQEAAAYFERLEKMVDGGVITQEAAVKEKLRLQSTHSHETWRGSVQRQMASVNPALKPLSIQHFTAKPMEFILD